MNRQVWKPVKAFAWDYPRRNYGIVYFERDDGERQVRYFIDRGGENCDETIITLPENHAICELVAADSPPPVPTPTAEVRAAMVAAVRALWDTQTLEDMQHGDVLFDLLQQLAPTGQEVA